MIKVIIIAKVPCAEIPFSDNPQFNSAIQAALDNITLREENEALEIALQESDDENQSLRKSLSKYESKNSKASKNTPTVKE